MPYAFVDMGNQLIQRLHNEGEPPQGKELQRVFDTFVQFVSQRGTMDLCVGQTHLIQIHDLPLHFHRNPKRESRWDVRRE